MDKTIKKLADEVGVSKTAVSKKIDKLGLRSRLIKVKNQWFIPESLQDELLKSFTDRKPQTQSYSSVDTLVTTLQSQVKDLQTQVQTLTNQLEIKDEQIKARDEQINKFLLLSENKPLQIEQKKEPPKWQFWKR